MTPRCVAPLDDDGRDPGDDIDPRDQMDPETAVDLAAIPLCGAVATEERTVDGIVCPLCAAHAAELDEEEEEDDDGIDRRCAEAVG